MVVGNGVSRTAPRVRVRGAAARSAYTPNFTPEFPGQLIFHNGSIEPSNTVYVMYWIPPGFTIPSSVQTVVDSYFTDVAGASGAGASVYGDLTQYGISGSAIFGGSAVDTDAFPANENFCTYGIHCLSEFQIAQEIDNFATSKGWTLEAGEFPTDPTHLIMVYLPEGVVDCFEHVVGEQDICSANASDPAVQFYCAYHTAETNGSVSFVWGNMPYLWNDSRCQGGEFPNGSPDADAAVDVTSHEYIEAQTDPYLNGWSDANGFEIADKCQTAYGIPLGTSNSNFFNQSIGTGIFWTQLEYSNASKSCFQVNSPTITSFTSTTVSGEPAVTISGSNFYFGSTGFDSGEGVFFNGHAASSLVDSSPTSVTAVVPDVSGTAGKITLKGIGGAGTSSQSYSGLPPMVSGLSTTQGVTGATVTVNGEGFFGVTHVTVGGVAATFSMVASNGTSLKTVIPLAAVDGPIAVTTGAGTGAGSDTFTVLPTITSFTPTSGAAGTSVTINGSGFGAANGVTFVGDGDADGIPVSSGVNQIVVQVPTNTELGPITVHTHSGADNATSSGSFAPLPSITGFDHVNYQPGGTAQVLGANFTANGPVSVAVNGVTACTSCTATATSVTFTVPNTVSGTVTVTNGDGSATSASPLLIRPRIDSVNGSGGSGTIIVLAGAGFGGTTSVAFGDNTEPAAFAVAAGGAAVRVTVPAGATTGKIGVTNAGGTTLTASDYTIPATISSFAPLSAAAGVNMLINGNGLTGSTEVDFAGGASAVPTDVTATSLRVVVPSGAITGPISVHTSSGVVTTTRPLVIALSITNVNPGSGPGTTGVTITGTGFTGRVTSVKFNGVSADFTVVSATQITAIVPTGATTGPITVTANGLTVTSAAPFTVT